MPGFENIEDVRSPRGVDIDIGAPDDEGWRSYTMTIELGADADPLIRFDHSLSDDCVDRLRRGLTSLIAGDLDHFEYEPLEPAFTFNFRRLDEDLIALVCIVDVSYVEGGPASGTGVGVAVNVAPESVRDFLAAL